MATSYKSIKEQKFCLIVTSCSIRNGTGHLRRSIVIAEELSKRNRKVIIITEDNSLSKEIAQNKSYIRFYSKNTIIPDEYIKNIKNIELLIVDLPVCNKQDYVGKNELLRKIDYFDSFGIPVISLGHASQITNSIRAVIDLYPGKSMHSANYINGPEYVILRDEFKYKISKKTKEKCILVSMGGSDPFNITHQVIKSLYKSKIKEKIYVILGSGYSDEKKKNLNDLVSESKLKIDIINSPQNMHRLLSQSTLAIVGFGTTAFECMSQGIPCITFTHYEWQEQSAQLFDSLNCSKHIGCVQRNLDLDLITQTIKKLYNDKNELEKISLMGSKIIDGLGSERVVDILEQYIKEQKDSELDHLYILAHPGDEVFGCGGTILNQVQNKEKVGIVFLGEGISSRYKEFDDKRLGKLEKSLETSRQNVIQKLKVNLWYNYQYQDNRFDKHDFLEIVKLIEKLILRHKPKYIYTHNISDLNIDHRITFKAVITACRPLADSSVKTIFSIEVPSSTDWGWNENNFNPNWINDISSVLDEKLKILENYTTEVREDPHPRSINSIKNRAHHWGSLYGINAAEVFKLIRHIN